MISCCNLLKTPGPVQCKVQILPPELHEIGVYCDHEIGVYCDHEIGVCCDHADHNLAIATAANVMVCAGSR